MFSLADEFKRKILAKSKGKEGKERVGSWDKGEGQQVICKAQDKTRQD